MTDQEYEEQKARIQAIVDRWRSVVGLNDWTLKLVYHRERYTEAPARLGSNECLWQYMESNVNFYLPACAERDDEQLEEDVVHELVHCITDSIDRIWTVDDDRTLHVEFVTSLVAKALRRAAAL